MKTFIITSVLLFIGVISFNVFVDKNFFWHRNSNFKHLKLTQGSCLKLSGEKMTGNDRLVHRQLRKDLMSPDTVIYASSRGAYADYGFFPGKNVYSTASSIALLEDYVDAWVDLKEMGKIPKEAVIFLDGWIFNDAINQFRSWDSLEGFNKFLKQVGLEDEMPPALKKRYRNEVKEGYRLNILNLLSFSQSEVSLKLLLSGEYKSLEILPCQDIKDDQTYMTWMGAHLSSKMPNHVDLIKTVGHPRSGLNYLDPWQKSDFLIKVFQVFIQDMMKNGVKVKIVTPLMHPTSASFIVEHEGVKDFKKIVSSLKAVDGFDVCDAFEADKVGCGQFDFKDGLHMTRECTGKLLKFCKIIP